MVGGGHLARSSSMIPRARGLESLMRGRGSDGLFHPHSSGRHFYPQPIEPVVPGKETEFRIAVPERTLWSLRPHQQPYRWSNVIGEGAARKHALRLMNIRPEEYLTRTSRGSDIISRVNSAVQTGSDNLGIWNQREVENRFLSGERVDPIQWYIDKKSCEVLGHEGRHRAAVAMKLYKKGHTKMKQIPILVACVSDYGFNPHRGDIGQYWRNHGKLPKSYAYVHEKYCRHCMRNFPEKITPQQEAHGREPWDDPRFPRSPGRKKEMERRKIWARERYPIHRCQKCNQRIDEDKTFCYWCEKHRTQRHFCEECGTRIPKDDTFCLTCERIKQNRCMDCGGSLGHLSQAGRKGRVCDACAQKRKEKGI